MIIYCSRSYLKGTAPELEAQTRRILATARVSNKKAHVTGALAFNEIGFAQVLEGVDSDVMPIFERIRRDPRHGDLRVLSRMQSARRVFPYWSMAYVGTPHGHGRHPLAHFEFEAALTNGALPQATQLLECPRQIVVAKSEPVAG
jgi:hypothetical protein